MFGLGKPRSKFGRFVDSNGISHGELVRISGVSKDTVTKACTEDRPKMRDISKDALVEAARKLSGIPVRFDDFWSF